MRQCVLCDERILDQVSTWLELNTCGHGACADCYLVWHHRAGRREDLFEAIGANRFPCPVVSCGVISDSFELRKPRWRAGRSAACSASSSSIGATTTTADGRQEYARTSSDSMAWGEPVEEADLLWAQTIMRLGTTDTTRCAMRIAGNVQASGGAIRRRDDVIALGAPELEHENEGGAELEHAATAALLDAHRSTMGNALGLVGWWIRRATLIHDLGGLDAAPAARASVGTLLRSAAVHVGEDGTAPAPLVCLMYALASGNSILPNREDLAARSADAQRVSVAAAVASDLVASHLVKAGVTLPTQGLIGQALFGFGNKVPVKIQSLLVKLCLTKQPRPFKAAMVGSGERPMLPVRRSLYSLWQLVCDNMHFIGKNAVEYVLLLWHEYTPSDLNSMGFFAIEWPTTGGPYPAAGCTPEVYAEALLKGPTADTFSARFPSPRTLAEPTEAAYGKLDEAEQCRVEEALRATVEIQRRIDLDTLCKSILDCDPKSSSAFDALARVLNTTNRRAGVPGGGDGGGNGGTRAVSVAYNPSAGVTGTHDDRTFTAPGAVTHAPTTMMAGVYGRNNCALSDIVKRKLGSISDVTAIAYWLQVVAGTGDTDTLKQYFIPKEDFTEAVPEDATTFPVDGWGAIARIVLSSKAALRAIASSDQSPVARFNRLVCADADGKHFGGVAFTCGCFHFHKELLAMTGKIMIDLVSRPLIAPFFPSGTNQQYYTNGGDPRPRWEAEPRFVLGFTIGLVFLYISWLKKQDEPPIDVKLVTWRHIHDHFDRVCRGRPSLFPLRQWLRFCDLALLVRGSGKSPDFELNRELGPLCAIVFATTNAFMYVRWCIDTRVLLETCDPWTYLVYKHIAFTKVTSRGQPRPTDEYQEQGVGDGRKISGAQSKVWYKAMEHTFRPRVNAMGQILQDRRNLTSTDALLGGGAIEENDDDGDDGDDGGDPGRDGALHDAIEAEEDASLANGTGNLFKLHDLRGEHIAGMQFALRLGNGLVDKDADLLALNNDKTIADTSFCSLINGADLNLALVAAPTNGIDRLVEYAARSFPYFPESEQGDGEGKAELNEAPPSKIIAGRVVGAFKREGEASMFAWIARNSQEATKISQHHNIVQTTTSADVIETGKSDSGKYFTAPMLIDELSELRQHPPTDATLRDVCLETIPSDVDTKKRSVKKLSEILSEVRRKGVPCSASLKAHEPSPPVLLDKQTGTFTRKGEAFEPFDQRFVANQRRENAHGEDSFPRFDLSEVDVVPAGDGQGGGGQGGDGESKDMTKDAEWDSVF